jgi:hypothetical protein
VFKCYLVQPTRESIRCADNYYDMDEDLDRITEFYEVPRTTAWLRLAWAISSWAITWYPMHLKLIV